jgi:plastocyanin
VLVGAVAAPAVAATRTVRVGSFYFDDSTPGDGRVEVDAGDKITFTFPESTKHSAKVDKLFDSHERANGQTFTTTSLTHPGTYLLYCTVHGAQTHSATLVIRAAGTSPSPSPSPAPPPPPPPPPSPSPSPSVAPSPTHTPTPTATPTRTPSATASSTPSRTAVPTESPAVPPTSAATPEATPTSTTRPTPTASRSDGLDALPFGPSSSQPPGHAAADAGSPSPSTGGATDLPPALSRNHGGWLLPVTLILVAAALGAASIAVAERRRTGS